MSSDLSSPKSEVKIDAPATLATSIYARLKADILTTRLVQTVVCLVAGRLGVALVPESFGRNLQVRGVEYRPLRGQPPLVELNAVWRKDNDLPLVRRFQHELHLLASRRQKLRVSAAKGRPDHKLP